MSPLRLAGVGIVVAAAMVAGALALNTRVGWLDWFFATVLFSAVGLMLLRAARAWRQTIAERRRMIRLSAADAGAVALAAVREERRRLGEDILGCLRQMLSAVRAEVSAALVASDPVPPIHRIRHSTQMATTELRRQLGLLRAQEQAVAEASPTPPRRQRGRPVPPVDLLLAATAMLLAAVESMAYPRIDGVQLSGTSVLLTVAAAGTIVGRSTAPGAAAFACGGVFLAGIGLDAPIEGGFWVLITVAGLLWSIGSRAGCGWVDLAGGVFLVVASSVHIAALSPENLILWLVVAGVASCGGLVVRPAMRLASSTRRLADNRETELRAAAACAVSAERQSFARELHDVVSHAVGVIAVQSGAAEVAWPADPTSTRASLRVIGETADGALAELNRLTPDLPPPTRTPADLHALVERIRSAGTPVLLRTDLGSAPTLPPEVFRTVQEGLTNVVRHAPGASARVSITAAAEQTTVEIVDDGPARTSSAHRGYGLVGLAERVAFAGGVLTTGPGPEGHGFRVAATLPGRVVPVDR